MATRNIVPRATEEGSIGTSSKNWLSAFFKTINILGEAIMKHITTPSNPASGNCKLYFKSDNKLYKLTSAGAESEVGAGGSGDMAKATYDTDDDGIVDSAEDIEPFKCSGVGTDTLTVKAGRFTYTSSAGAQIVTFAGDTDVLGASHTYYVSITKLGALSSRYTPASFPIDELPIAIVVVDGVGDITSITDCRGTGKLLLADGTTVEFNADGELGVVSGVFESSGAVSTHESTYTHANIHAASGQFNQATSGEIAGLTEKTTLHDNDIFLIEDSEASNAKKKVKKSNIGGSAQLTRATFTNANLSSGKLTITHSKALSAPYSVVVVIFDNNYKQIIPDDITGSTNSVEVDLTSYGTISGTWGYAYIS